jgi:hypothetical protein
MNIFVNGIDLTEPGKKILLLTQESLDYDTVMEIKRNLESLFPEHRFSILSGFDQAIVTEDNSNGVIDE